MKAKRKPLPPIVRIDEDEPGELYVLVVDDCGDYVPDSLHTDKPGAERRARWLAKMMGCKWYKNYLKTAAIGLALVVLAGAANAESITICTADGCRPVDAGLKIPASYWKPLSAEEQAMLSPPYSVGPKSQARVTTEPNGTSVKAKPEVGRHYATIPPVEFDHPYRSNMTINVVRSESEMQLACRKPVPFMMGCARVVDNVCVIHMRDEETLRRNNRTHDLVLRHEMGHCNGWKGHAGARLPAKEVTR